MKFSRAPASDTSNDEELRFVTTKRSTATGQELASTSVGIKGLKASSATSTGTSSS